MRLSGAEVAVAHLLLDYGNDLAALTPSALKVRFLRGRRRMTRWLLSLFLHARMS